MDFQKKYGKILLPLITPYDENEEIDYGKYAELIEYVITNDLCDSLIVTGTTGEASLLTFDERVKLFETAVKASAGRKPVIAGTGCASTKETIALTNKAYDLGIELALIVCPFYNKPTQEGLYLHYKTIAENTKANIMLYNIPIFVGVNLEAETVGRLAAIIAGLTVLALGGAWFLGIPVLSMLYPKIGYAIADSRLPLLLIILGGAFNAYINLFYYSLIIMQKRRHIFVIYALVAGAAFLISSPFVRWMGILGGALSYLMLMFALTVCFGLTALYFYRKENRNGRKMAK